MTYLPKVYVKFKSNKEYKIIALILSRYSKGQHHSRLFYLKNHLKVTEGFVFLNDNAKIGYIDDIRYHSHVFESYKLITYEDLVKNY